MPCLQPSRFEIFSPGRNPRTLAYMGAEWKRRGVEGVKGFLLLKRGGKKGQERGRGTESRGEEGPAAGGGILLQGLRGIDAPVYLRPLKGRQIFG